MQPQKKLVAAGLMLAAGLSAALMFPCAEDTGRHAAESAVGANVLPAVDVQPLEPSAPLILAHPPVASTPAVAIGLAMVDAAAGSPPLEDSPITPRDEATPPVGPSQHPAGRPIYAPLWDPEEDDLTAGPAIHVVHNGDTLERLAERYLGDRARALEIFDLNRDVLENPHLLPIGAELRLPAPEPVGR